jgi:hypothetical protein
MGWQGQPSGTDTSLASSFPAGSFAGNVKNTNNLDRVNGR